MVIIKKIEVPQDVYIIGDWIEGFKESFSITDDESSFALRNNGGKVIWLTTIGFVYILTLEELIANKASFEEGFVDNFLVKNFVGELVLKVIDSDNNDLITAENFDKDEYIMHQE